MTAVEEAPVERKQFIRPDGKEKVTGTGRYTADLTLAGQLVAKFRYADHTHARILRIDTTLQARALPGVLAVVTHEDVPDVLYGGMVKDRRLFAKDTVRFEGDIVAGRRGDDGRDRRAGRSADRGRLRAAPGRHRLRGGDRRRRDARPPRLGRLRGPTTLGRDRQHARLLDDRQGRRRRRAGRRRRRRQGPLRHRPRAGRPDRAARGDRAVAGRQGHGLDVDPGAVRGPRRRRAHAPDPRVERPRDRAAARRRLRRQVRLPLRGPRRRARARGRRRPVKLVFSRREEFFAVGHRREGMVIELETGAAQGRHARRPRGPARARQGRLLRRGRLLRADGGDARARARTSSRTSTSSRRSSTPTTSRRPRSAPRRRRRCAGRSSSTWTSSPRRSGWIRSSCAAAR